MPWLTIIMMVISWLLSPKDNANDRKRALLSTAAVGAGTYFLTETSTGRDLIGLDGDTTVPTTVTNADGTVTQVKRTAITTGVGGLINGFTAAGGTTSSVPVGTGGKLLSGFTDSGLVAATGAAVVGASLLSKYAPWLIGFGALFLITRKS